MVCVGVSVNKIRLWDTFLLLSSVVFMFADGLASDIWHWSLLAFYVLHGLSVEMVAFGRALAV